MNHQEDPGRMQLLYVNQDTLSNLYLSLGRPMCGEPMITDLFAFIAGDQATCRQVIRTPSPIPSGEDHQYSAIDHPLPMAHIVQAAEEN
ncbi:uncharacterized protein TNIN_342781 [Trichonephila inaurata madagascariensis]|uniref:Uncharacterized protein n=1 Tax=Trichonephila inaurata madagascariensis TaxID=2747483 RepID=A0A8X7C1R8_9ARAC|nr:uncharacterized protein TNIN_342781 [Trichonephila inaurata madagascariensis]